MSRIISDVNCWIADFSIQSIKNTSWIYIWTIFLIPVGLSAEIIRYLTWHFSLYFSQHISGCVCPTKFMLRSGFHGPKAFVRSADPWPSFKSILNSIEEFCLVEIIVESDFKFRFIGIDNDSNTGSICRNIKSFDQIPHPTLIRVPFDGSRSKATGLFSLVKTVYFNRIGRTRHFQTWLFSLNRG